MGLLTAALSTTVVFSSKISHTEPIERIQIKKWETKISQKFGISCIYIEKFLVSRPVHVVRELFGIFVSPFILICRVLPRIADVRNGIGLNSPNNIENVVPFCDDRPPACYLSDFPNNDESHEEIPWNFSDDDATAGGETANDFSI